MTRWMSFHEHAERWDRRWHLELMAHSYSWWQQGKSPWAVCGGAKPDAASADTTFSHRVNAWCVAHLFITFWCLIVSLAKRLPM